MPSFAIGPYLAPYASTLRPCAYYATWAAVYASYLVQPGLITLLQLVVLVLAWLLPPLERWTERARMRMRRSDWATERWAWAHAGGRKPPTKYPKWVKRVANAVDYKSAWLTTQHLPPTHTGGAPTGSGHHRSSSSISSLSHLGLGMGLPAAPGGGLQQTNQTRVLLLSNFSPALKTKDLQDLLADWQDDHGGLKVKWRDDTSAWVVFADPTVAKRAFLSLVSSPPAALSPAATHTYAPCITPYTGPDVAQILQAVQNRPRSRSIAGQGTVSGGHGHARRGSGVGGSAGAAALAGLAGAGSPPPPLLPPQLSGPAPAPPLPHGHGPGPVHGHGHNRTASWTRQSIDRRAREAAAEGGAAGSPPGSSPVEGPGPDGHWRTSSPETPGGPGGILAGEAPRRFGNAGAAGAAAGSPPAVNGHRRTESRSGSEVVASAIAGLTIRE
ncbi:hypothetical protein JCM3770_000603 [Rhodotorula araucariae]